METEDTLWVDVRNECMEKLAYALFYTTILNPDWDKKQKKRLQKMYADFMHFYYCDAKVKWMGFLEVIGEEIENLC